jgi:hypothetical protein
VAAVYARPHPIGAAPSLLAPRPVAHDYCELIQIDHADHERALRLLADLTTPPRDLAEYLEILQLALSIHAAAEIKALELVVGSVTYSRAVDALVRQIGREHALQRSAVQTLTRIRPASLAWYEHVAELSILVLDHGGRAEHTRWRFHDQLPYALQRLVASEYATERLRMLATTSPVLVADRRQEASGCEA